MLMVTAPRIKCKVTSRPFSMLEDIVYKMTRFTCSLHKIKYAQIRMQMCHNCSFEMLSAVLYNSTLGFHKIALQELREKLELLSIVINNMQQMLKKYTVPLKFT